MGMDFRGYLIEYQEPIQKMDLLVGSDSLVQALYTIFYCFDSFPTAKVSNVEISKLTFDFDARKVSMLITCLSAFRWVKFDLTWNDVTKLWDIPRPSYDPTP